MKKRILSILLTVAMLVAMVPAIAVSASTTDTYVSEGNGVYRVDSIAAVDKFLSDKTVNITGNTMKLGADLDYSSVTVGSGTYVNGLWAPNDNYLQANVNGNGHTVTIPGGKYAVCILSYLTANADYTIKNLKVQMATKDGVQAVASGDKVSLFAGRFKTTNFTGVSFENCYFDVNFECTSNATSAGTAILFGINDDWQNSTEWELNTTNCYFKMHAKVAGGRHGALFGALNSTAKNKVKMNIVDSIFDVTYTKATDAAEDMVCAAVVGAWSESLYSVSNTSEGNLSYNGTQLTLRANEDKLSSCFSKIGSDNANNEVTTVAGFQTTAVKEGKFDLRLVGLIDLGNNKALTDFSKVGFVVKATHGNNFVSKGIVIDSNKVYTAITANDATGTKQLTAAEINADADYIFALAITGLPELNAGRTLTLDVMPYYIDAEGNTVCGVTKTITVTTTPSGDIVAVAA